MKIKEIEERIIRLEDPKLLVEFNRLRKHYTECNSSLGRTLKTLGPLIECPTVSYSVTEKPLAEVEKAEHRLQEIRSASEQIVNDFARRYR